MTVVRSSDKQKTNPPIADAPPLQTTATQVEPPHVNSSPPIQEKSTSLSQPNPPNDTNQPKSKRTPRKKNPEELDKVLFPLVLRSNSTECKFETEKDHSCETQSFYHNLCSQHFDLLDSFSIEEIKSHIGQYRTILKEIAKINPSKKKKHPIQNSALFPPVKANMPVSLYIALYT